MNPRGIHNFSYGTLASYFKIESLAEKGKVSFPLDGKAIAISGMPGKYQKKLFVYDANVDQQELKQLHNEYLIYSIDKLQLSNEKPFEEVEYKIDEVFDPSQYRNSKKRYQRLKYPFKFLTDNEITISTVNSSDLDECITLHDDWVQAKLDDPKTFRMMFPTARYKNCLKIALSNTEDYKTYKAMYNGTIIAVRVVHAYNNQAFDLAFFSNFWSTPSQTTTYLNVAILKELKISGIATLNLGAGLNKHLHMAKSHYPWHLVKSWMYSIGS